MTVTVIALCACVQQGQDLQAGCSFFVSPALSVAHLRNDVYYTNTWEREVYIVLRYLRGRFKNKQTTLHPHVN